MKTKKKPRKGRNENGQWLPGVCGNKQGRGAKTKPLPKSLSEELADAMAQKVAVTDATGKQQTMSAYEAAALRLVSLSAEANSKELMAMMSWLEEHQVPAVMRQRAEDACEAPITRQDRELLKEVKKLMEEKRAANQVEAEEEERKLKARTKTRRNRRV